MAQMNILMLVAGNMFLKLPSTYFNNIISSLSKFIWTKFESKYREKH